MTTGRVDREPTRFTVRERLQSAVPDRSTRWVAGIATAAALARLPQVGFPLSPDEGGFLLVASQWSPGRSLYGDYWVDRPPLLIDFFRLADLLGDGTALRLLGLVLVFLSVLAAGRIGFLVGAATSGGHAARRTAVATASTAAVFLVHPLFGSGEVNGELIAMPAVLTGIALALEAAATAAPVRRHLLLFGAGAAGAAAILVKQNELDVVIVVVVGAVTFLRTGRAGSVLGTLGSAAAGAASLTLLVLLHAASRGTGPAGLWDAVVTFRFEAAAVIQASASGATTTRLQNVVLALLVSGAPLLVLAFLRRVRTRPVGPDLRWPILALIGWDTFTVGAGGSYWLHYLVCLVPALVMCVAEVSAADATRLPTAGRDFLPRALALSALVCVVSIAVAVSPPVRPTEEPVNAWLRAHAEPGDSAVIAYGRPNVLRASGLTSPYPLLWSLPVRVRDPELAELSALLADDDRPDWVITVGEGLASWGIDPTDAAAELATHYLEVADVDGHHVFLERSRELATR